MSLMAAAAPSHDSDKPHPPIPVSRSSHKTLTIESIAHLRHFLGHVLEEETGFRDADKDAWVSRIESALNDLAKAVDSGAWLSGIRRARAAERKRKEQQAAAEVRVREQERIAKEKEKDSEARNKTKSRAPANADSTKAAKEADAAGSEVKTDSLHAHKPPSDAAANRNLCALQQLRKLANARRPPRSDDSKLAHHLLLTVALPEALTPRPSLSVSAGDATAPKCTFSPGVYSLPAPDLFGEDPDDNCQAVVNSALYGFQEWDVNSSETHDDIELVGGTFSLSRMRSADEHASVVRVLRVSTYVLLSLLLEQHFLSSSSVQLHYPNPKPIQPSISLPPPKVPIPHRNSSPEIQVEVKHRKRDLLRNGIWSLFQKRLNRSVTVNTSDSRGISLDLTDHEPILYKSPRSSLDSSPPPSAPRQRRFSIFGESRATPPPPPAPPPELSPDRTFQSALRCIEEGKAMLSASPGLIFQPPQLLVRLAECEKANPARRPTGEERTGLTSILGWEGKKAAAHGNMTGVAGFLRQQQLSLLYSEHVHVPDRASPSSADGTLNKPVEREPKSPVHVHCGTPVQWVTYMYYTSGNHDRSLGDMITSICMRADEPCAQPGCKALQRHHEQRWMHGGMRVVARTDARDLSESRGIHSEDIDMWQSCKICQKSTARCKMSDGTYLFSFAKFLELLLYSPVICTLSHTLCAHTSSSSPRSSLPASRFNIIRHFSYKAYRVSFTLSPIDEIFDLRMPRLQFTKLMRLEKTPPATTLDTMMDEADKKELRQEIRDWWQAVAEHLDKVEAEFSDRATPHPKSLPRLPSSDDAWENLSDGGLTPKGLLPVSLPPTPAHSAQPSSSSLATIKPGQSDSDSSFEAISSSDEPSDADSPLRLLTNMRFTFQRAEQALYAQLRDTPHSGLNNVRREFHSTALGASRRLAAWEAKHVSKDARPRLAADREAIREPRWWQSGYHAVPGGNVIVQEEDWGSIIAFTLSSFDYQHELASMMHHPRASPAATPAPHPPTASRRNTASSSLGGSSASNSTSSFKFFGSSHKPDPDREDSVWHEPEAYSAVLSRKEHPRDPTALLSLRDVLRHKVPVESSSHGTQTSAITSVSRMVNNAAAPAPPSAWAKPAVEVNMAAVDGHVTGMPEAAAVITAGRILHELDGASSVLSSKGSIDSATSAFVETNVHRGKTSSLLPRTSLEGDGGPTTATGSPPVMLLGDNIAFPMAQRAALVASGSPSRSSTVSTTHDASGHEAPPAAAGAGAAPNDSAIQSWTNSLTNAMRYMLKGDLLLPSRPTTPPPGATGAQHHHHGLLYADPLTIDERPHIKYDWTIGRRLRFSCTVYYAKQFDALRRRCGVEEAAGFVRSMARCEPWKAQGGKSRSNFWKTADDRFIVKTLVNAWNVADLQVLIELAPSYFMHMESTASRASILAKLLGFYTVEVRNLETGTVLAKADLLVMENVFHGQKPTKTFDLKGIQGRKVKASSNTSASKTLFDSEWIEGQQRALTLVNPISKAIFQEAVRADCEFLARSNIMDYSLLLGVDEEGKQIHCGLVDTIGSYTFAKTLEYKAKGLSGKEGKDITVVPPHEYQERLVSALDSYFMACPDKWTKPADEAKLIHDPAHLPSVL